MAISAEILVKEASGLPYSERAKLVDTLLTTLDPVAEDDCDTTWYAEISLREQALASGSVKTFSWDETKRQARERVNG